MDLRAEYLNKLKSVLEEIEQDPLQDLRETSGHRNLEKTDSLYDDALETAVQSGRLKGVLISLPTNQDIVQTGNKYRRFYIKNAEDLDFKAIKSALFVSLKNENGDSILEERFSKGGPSFSSRLYLGAESRRSGNRIEMYELDSVSSADFSSVNYFYISNNLIYVDPHREYRILLFVDQQTLQVVRNVEVAIGKL